MAAIFLSTMSYIPIIINYKIIAIHDNIIMDFRLIIGTIATCIANINISRTVCHCKSFTATTD